MNERPEASDSEEGGGERGAEGDGNGEVLLTDVNEGSGRGSTACCLTAIG